MTHRCANPECRFDYSGMRAVCARPACLETPPPGCGRFYRLRPDGTLDRLPPGAAPPPGEAGIFWLCCYCAMQYDLVAPGHLRLAPDPYAFIWRWQIENAEASVTHEGA